MGLLFSPAEIEKKKIEGRKEGGEKGRKSTLCLGHQNAKNQEATSGLPYVT